MLVDGRPLPAYQRAYVECGRVFAPLAAVVLRVADRVWLENDTLVIQRDGRRVRVRVGASYPQRMGSTYVAVGPLLRQLGEAVDYQRAGRRLEVTTVRPTVAQPSPFAANAPSVPPRSVFTPQPVPTPRPVWTGSPLPRRTPLPLPPS